VKCTMIGATGIHTYNAQREIVGDINDE